MITENNIPNLKETLNLFYQKEIPSDKATYYVTEQRFNLLKARAKAEQDNQVWQDILQAMACRFTEYAVRDFSNLADNSCYEGEMLLHRHTPFLDDDELLLARLNGTRLLLRLLVSVLGPFYHLYLEEMSGDTAKSNYKFKTVEPEQVGCVEIVQEVKQIVEKYHYIFLERNTLREVVPDLTTEYHGAGEVLLFHCIFSDFLGHY